MDSEAGHPVTLRQIAREAGVSIATVSRALRRPDAVSAETRARILALVARHRYVPDALAASFASRRTGLVGLIVPTISNSIYAEFTEAVQNRLQAAGRKLLIANANYSATLESEIVHKLVESRVEGVIFTGCRRDQVLYELLRHYRIPFVVTWSTSDDPSIPAISFDNFAAAKAATNALIALGHRRIGLVCGVSAVNDRAQQRIAGFRAGLEEAAIDFDPALIAERPFEVAEGAAAAEAIMGNPHPPTALFCANDIQALGALFACQRLGFAVPRDVSIIGFDDLPMTRMANPPLATVHVPAQEMGEAAARALVRAVDLGEPIHSRALDAMVVVRDSIAAPPG
jgi:DNA-binding LacI/PurR family transcriptional regulator